MARHGREDERCLELISRTDFTSYFKNHEVGDFYNCNLGVKSGRNFNADILKRIGCVHIDEEKP